MKSRTIKVDYLARVEGEAALVLVQARGHALCAPIGKERLHVRVDLGRADDQLRVVADALLPLVEERQHPPEDESVQEVQDQQEVDDLEGELEDVDPEGVEECHGGCDPR